MYEKKTIQNKISFSFNLIQPKIKKNSKTGKNGTDIFWEKYQKNRKLLNENQMDIKFRFRWEFRYTS